MKKLIPFVLFAVFCLCASLEADEIYQWVDKNGVMHFTNQPPPPGAKIVNQQQAIPYDEAADQRNRQQEQEVLEQQQSEQQQFEQQQSQADQQAGNPQEAQGAPQVQSEGSDSDNAVEGVIVNPYVRNREELRRRYERRNPEDEEIVTPRPRPYRTPERMR
jgi:hypothetical protein